MCVIHSLLFVHCSIIVPVLCTHHPNMVTDFTEEKRSNITGDEYIGVFKSLKSVKECLNKEKYVNLPEVQELLTIFNNKYFENSTEELDRSQRKVFIVLEGIDASGKETIGARLCKLISGRQLSTPHHYLLSLRPAFDAHGLELRHAYYALGNYLAAQQVRKLYAVEPIVIDRFWHSTAAYALARQAVSQSNGSIPLEGDPVYEWPRDLLRPDIVFFLSVSESKRIDRLLRSKARPVTREEVKKNDNKALREALKVIFLRMRNPGINFYNNDYFRTTMTRLTAYLEHYSTTLTF